MSQSTFKFGDRVVHSARPEWGPGTVVRVESVRENGQPAQRLQIRFPGVGLKVFNTSVARIIPASDSRTILDAAAEPAADIPPIVQTAAPPVNGAKANANGVKFNGTTAARNEANARPASNGVATTVSQAHRPVAQSPANPGGRRPSDAPKSANGWLSSLEQQNPSDLMLQVSEDARDPFRSVWDRMQSSLDLYRFTPTARGITEWAIAQSGLEDPLTIFNRQELETLFQKWTRSRDLHLASLVEEATRTEGGGDRARQMIARSGYDAAKQALRRYDARR